MIILVLTHTYPDQKNKWRGIFVQEQVKALSKKHEIIVVYFKVDYTQFAPFSLYSFTKKQLGKITEYQVTVNKSFPVITQLKFLTSVYGFIKKEILSQRRPDIIHSHLSYPAGFLGSVIQQKLNIPNIITEHSRIRSYFRSLIHKRCVHYGLKKATRVISVSNALKEEIVSFCNRPVIVIHNIVDTEIFAIRNSSPGTILNIGFLGGLNNNNKGLDLLLKSVSALKNFMLHIGGDGILLNNFKDMARELGVDSNCKFYGEISRNDIAGFYSQLDIFVLPSRYETFGIVLIEAMACGIPVIATKCGGPEEIVTPETGILIQKDSIVELQNAIERISDNRNAYNKDIIRNYAKESFGQEVFVNRISKLYQEILTEKSNE